MYIRALNRKGLAQEPKFDLANELNCRPSAPGGAAAGICPHYLGIIQPLQRPQWPLSLQLNVISSFLGAQVLIGSILWTLPVSGSPALGPLSV